MQPVHCVAAVARAGDPLPRRSTNGSFATASNTASRSPITLPPQSLRDLVDELLAEPGRAARVGRRDDPPLRRPERRVPAVRPRVVPRALRTAVDQEDDRILLRLDRIPAA